MKGWNTICVVFAAFFSVFLCNTLPAGPVGQPSPVDTMKFPLGQPSPVDAIKFPYSQGTGNVVMASGDACPTNKKGLISKTQTLHVPFITNNGQVDEQVKFYAKTFGGAVFVTKDGEIVYSLPSGRDALHASLDRAESAFAANGYASLFRADDAHCPPDRLLAKSLLAAYLPELQESTGRLTGTRSTVSLRPAYLPELQEGTTNPVGTRCPCPPRFAYLPGLQNGTDKQRLSMPPHTNPNILPAKPQSAFQNPQSPIQCVSLKETLVGANISQIHGEGASAAKVSYFKGNDPSQWKTNLATAELVNLGEVYEGIGLKLRAYGNNVEKLFCVKPGANPKEIKIRLSGLSSGESDRSRNDIGSGKARLATTRGTSKSILGTFWTDPRYDFTFMKDIGNEFPFSKDNENSPLENGVRGLSVNEHGELEIETELGAVKFTKPVAYQEIDGKRVEVACEYTIAEGGTNLEFGIWNLDWFPYSEINNFRSPNPQSKTQIPQSTTHNSQLTTHNFKL